MANELIVNFSTTLFFFNMSENNLQCMVEMGNICLISSALLQNNGNPIDWLKVINYKAFERQIMYYSTTMQE